MPFAKQSRPFYREEKRLPGYKYCYKYHFVLSIVTSILPSELHVTVFLSIVILGPLELSLFVTLT